MSDRKRGIMVYPLKKEFREGEDDYCVGVNPNTKEVFMIHRPEGVTYRVRHNKPWRFNDYNVVSSWHTVIEVLGMADWDNPIDLADMVRSFGARLESNFYLASCVLTNMKSEDKDYNESHAKTIWEYWIKNGVK